MVQKPPNKPNHVEVQELHLFEFFAELLRELDRLSLPYALLHGMGTPEELLRSDVDMVLGEKPDGRFAELVSACARNHGLRVLQALFYEVPYGFYFIVGSGRAGSSYIHLDCLHDPWGVNRYWLPSHYLLDGASRAGSVQITAADKVAVHLLLKRCIKQRFGAEQLTELHRSLAGRSEAVAQQLRQLTGKGWQAELEALAAPQSGNSWRDALDALRGSLPAAMRNRHPIRWLAGSLLQVFRQILRFVQPTGFFVVFIGPDGCGKSTVKSALQVQMERAFRNTWAFHWRPGVLPKLGKGAAAAATGVQPPPTGASAYAGPVSWFRFVYYWLDFVLGYWLRIYPRRARTTLVIGERYFADVIVNPGRYGFSVSGQVLRLARMFVPRPDLTVLLTNDASVIHARKPELSEAQIREQLAALGAELRSWKSSMTVVTDRPPQNVVDEIAAVIAERCENRTLQRLGIRL